MKLYTGTSGLTLTPAEKLKADLITNKFNGDESAYWWERASYSEKLNRLSSMLNGGENQEETDGEGVDVPPLPPRWMTTKSDTKKLDQELRANSVWAEQERTRRWNEVREAELAARHE